MAFICSKFCPHLPCPKDRAPSLSLTFQTPLIIPVLTAMTPIRILAWAKPGPHPTPVTSACPFTLCSPHDMPSPTSAPTPYFHIHKFCAMSSLCTNPKPAASMKFFPTGIHLILLCYSFSLILSCKVVTFSPSLEGKLFRGRKTSLLCLYTQKETRDTW